MPLPEEGDRRSTVLVVDDAPENIAAMAAVLNGDYRTKAATSGEKALALAQSGSGVDLILLDVVMPGMDGHEVCPAAQARSEDHGHSRHLPDCEGEHGGRAEGL